MLDENILFLHFYFRYLDDVSLHHLINALCSLSLEAMDMAYGNNKVWYSFFSVLNIGYIILLNKVYIY